MELRPAPAHRESVLAEPPLAEGIRPRPPRWPGLLVALILGLWGVATLFPLLWMVLGALLPEELIRASPLSLMRLETLSRLGFDNLAALLAQARLGRWMLNSLGVALACTAAHLLLDSMAGYGFARGRFPGRGLLFACVLATMMVPGQVLALPTFAVIRDLGLLDSLWAIILPSLAGPFGIFLMRQTIQGIPRELEEAARVDGASDWRVYAEVILPLCRPALATLGIFVFMSHWNALLWPLIVLLDADNYTLTVGLATLQGKHAVDYGLLMAGATIAALPAVLAFLLGSRHFLEALGSGALKG